MTRGERAQVGSSPEDDGSSTLPGLTLFGFDAQRCERAGSLHGTKRQLASRCGRARWAIDQGNALAVSIGWIEDEVGDCVA